MQHTFTLTAFLLTGTLAAQTTCDSLHVESVVYAPFGNGLEVSIHNGSQQMLSGPVIDVLDAKGDQISNGNMQFFAHMPGATLMNQVYLTTTPPNPFTGTVVMHYSDGEGSVDCLLPLTNWDLCPVAEPCIPLLVYGYHQGGAVPMDLDWSVTDTNNISVASGVLHLEDVGFGFGVNEVCLPPGEYTLHMSQAIPSGTLLQVGVMQEGSSYTDGTGTQLPIGGSVDHPFTYYGECVDLIQGITTPLAAAPALTVDGNTLRITTNTGNALGAMYVLDATGRIVHSTSSTVDTATMQLGALAPGTYILRSLNSASPWPAQRFNLN